MHLEPYPIGLALGSLMSGWPLGWPRQASTTTSRASTQGPRERPPQKTKPSRALTLFLPGSAPTSTRTLRAAFLF